MAQTSVGGIVLCGGKSSRMGQPKLTLPFDGETMLSRVVCLLRQVVEPVIVVAGPYQDVPALPEDVQIWRDEQEHLGPLAGMLVGLRALADKTDAAFVSSCDVPLLRAEFVAAMIQRLGEHELCVPHDGEFHHSLAGVYRTSLVSRIQWLVSQNRLRPLFLIQESDSVEVPIEELRKVDPQLESLHNLNRPEDYQRALSLHHNRLAIP